MMKLTIGHDEYTAKNAVSLIDQIKMQHWHAGPDTTAEEYIALQESVYEKLTGRRMDLPKADTETRAREMLKKCADAGAWIFEEGRCGDE